MNKAQLGIGAVLAFGDGPDAHAADDRFPQGFAALIEKNFENFI